MSDRKRFEKAQKGIRRNRRRDMPFVRGSDEKAIAIFLADIHLTIKPPVWRSAEPDWLEAQARPLLEVQDLQKKYDCPILCAGDIFDKWNVCPELINWAIDYLPDNMYAIPGQHDLPLHQYDDLHRSAYLTLVKANKIQNILPECYIVKDNMIIQGFPFGYEIKSCSANTTGFRFNIAIVHDYVWIPGKKYPNAPVEKRVSAQDKDNWLGYNAVVYGDNHKGFQTTYGGVQIFNCGTLMRRKSDEINYRPQVGLLLESSKIIPHYLDISKDKYLDTTDTEEKHDLDMTGFIDGLEKLGKTALDFREAMKMFLHRGKTSAEAKQIILDAMEK